MRRSAQGKRRRAANLQARIGSDKNDHFPRCLILDCNFPTQRAAKKGLSIAYCRRHQIHQQRHGSPFCRSPSALILKPYKDAASEFIETHRDDIFVKSALLELGNLLEFAGPVIIATRLRGLPPKQRARVALARLREAGIKSERLLAIAISVNALVEHAPEHCHRIRDWIFVAIAKAAHRLASGYHRVWEVRDDSGRLVTRTELHVFPRSTGRVLRHLGEAIEKKCEGAIEHHLAQVVALKVARDKARDGTS